MQANVEHGRSSDQFSSSKNKLPAEEKDRARYPKWHIYAIEDFTKLEKRGVS